MKVIAAQTDNHFPHPWSYAPSYEILPGVLFGRPDQLLTPAYWALRCETSREEGRDFVNRDGSRRGCSGVVALSQSNADHAGRDALRARRASGSHHRHDENRLRPLRRNGRVRGQYRRADEVPSSGSVHVRARDPDDNFGTCRALWYAARPVEVDVFVPSVIHRMRRLSRLQQDD